MNSTVIEAFQEFIKQLNCLNLDLEDEYDVNTINAMKMVKYWSSIKFKSSKDYDFIMQLIIDYYQKQGFQNPCKYVDIELCKLLEYIYLSITELLSDKKRNFNGLSYIDLFLIKEMANEDLKKAIKALELEKNKDYNGSLEVWKEILGKDFPKYRSPEGLNKLNEKIQSNYDNKTTNYAKRIL